MTPLEALERLYSFYDLPYRNEIAYMLEQENLGEYKEIIEKALKALEVIKEKVMPLVSLDDGEVYKGCYRVYDAELYMHTELTKEEFDLLKEVLK